MYTQPHVNTLIYTILGGSVVGLICLNRYWWFAFFPVCSCSWSMRFVWAHHHHSSAGGKERTWGLFLKMMVFPAVHQSIPASTLCWPQLFTRYSSLHLPSHIRFHTQDFSSTYSFDLWNAQTSETCHTNKWSGILLKINFSHSFLILKSFRKSAENRTIGLIRVLK